MSAPEGNGKQHLRKGLSRVNPFDACYFDDQREGLRVVVIDPFAF
jgi:hypothetical protein